MSRLQTAIVETIVDVADGTVYKVVAVVADGAAWPSTLYVVAIYFAPMCKKDVTVATSAAVVVVTSFEVSAMP